jgi:hypothetical protein
LVAGLVIHSNAYREEVLREHGEQMKVHLHVRLIVYSGGEKTGVPANIGISPGYWPNSSYAEYGLLGIAPLHTHDVDNVIHVEAKEDIGWTFGHFLEIWGRSLPEGASMKTNDMGSNVLYDVPDPGSHVLRDGETLSIYLPKGAYFE